MPGVETPRHRDHVEDVDVGGQFVVDPAADLLGGGGAHQIDVRHLRQRVDAGVGAAGALSLHQHLAERRLDRPFELALDGAGVDVPGSRPSALFFFSVECGACGPGAQSLAEAQKAVGAKANFVAVNVNPGDTDGDINGFLRDNQAKQLALIRDTNARLLQAYQVTQLSTAVILNASGQVVYRGVDPTAAQIQSELAKVGAR